MTNTAYCTTAYSLTVGVWVWPNPVDVADHFFYNLSATALFRSLFQSLRSWKGPCPVVYLFKGWYPMPAGVRRFAVGPFFRGAQ
jgi:hypothetical protein